MRKHPVLFYGWFIVAAGIVSYAVGYGARYSFSVIFISLLEEFQWPRDITAAMLSVHMLIYGLVAPGAGSLVDRIGPRKTMAFGTILLSLGLALSGLGNQPWHFYLTFGLLTGAGLCMIGAVPFTSVLRNWFEKKRGLAFSLLFFGAGGSFAFYPVVVFLINHVNWRITFLIEGIVIFCLMLPLIIFVVRYHPREMGLEADGGPKPKENFRGEEKMAPEIKDRVWTEIDWTLPKAVRTGRFWMLCLSSFCIWGVSEHILVTHHIAFAMDVGYSKTYASSVLSLLGLFFAFGSLAALVSDRIGRELTLTIGSIFGISGILVLILIKDSSQPWMLSYYSIALGFGLGITSPTIAASATDIFQGPRVGAIIGFVWFSFSIGGAIGPWLGGWIFERVKDYQAAFILALVLYAFGCVAIWWAAPRKVRLVPGMVNSRLKGI